MFGQDVDDIGTGLGDLIVDLGGRGEEYSPPGGRYVQSVQREDLAKGRCARAVGERSGWFVDMKRGKGRTCARATYGELGRLPFSLVSMTTA